MNLSWMWFSVILAAFRCFGVYLLVSSSILIFLIEKHSLCQNVLQFALISLASISFWELCKRPNRPLNQIKLKIFMFFVNHQCFANNFSLLMSSLWSLSLVHVCRPCWYRYPAQLSSMDVKSKSDLLLNRFWITSTTVGWLRWCILVAFNWCLPFS